MTRTIVTIDDSEIATEVIRATLADFGYDRVSTFLDPAEALEALAAKTVEPDLILLDVMMPGMNGIELCAHLRGHAHLWDVPIVMLTSRTEMETLSEAFMAGANDYVVKPFERIELQARLRSCLRLKSELDRRNHTAPAPAAPPDAAPAAAGPGAVCGLLPDRAAFETALNRIAAPEIARLGLVAFRIGPRDRVSQANRRALDAVVPAVAEVLMRVPVPAGDMLAHWQDDIFVLASLACEGEPLPARAQRFVDAVAASGLEAPGGVWSEHLRLGAGVATVMATVAAGLADALNRADEARDAGAVNG